MPQTRGGTTGKHTALNCTEDQNTKGHAVEADDVAFNESDGGQAREPRLSVCWAGRRFRSLINYYNYHCLRLYWWIIISSWGLGASEKSLLWGLRSISYTASLSRQVFRRTCGYCALYPATILRSGSATSSTFPLSYRILYFLFCWCTLSPQPRHGPSTSLQRTPYSK